MYKEISFNENDPSLENIDIVLGKILFCLTSASVFNDYYDLQNEIKKELNKFRSLLKIYINSKDLFSVDFGLLNSIAIKISTLDCQTVTRDGMYLEMADVWLSILIGYYKLSAKEKNYGKR